MSAIVASLAVLTSLTVYVISSPQMMSIPPGAQRVEMLQLNLTASCDGPVTVQSLAIFHEGLGDTADIQRVYAVSGNRRISRSATIARFDGSAQLRFSNFSIPACESVDVGILADMAASSAVAGEHRFVLRRFADTDAGSAVVHGVLARSQGGRRTVGAVQGSVNVEYLDLLLPTTYGSQRTLARLRVTASSDGDQLLSAVTFTNEGSARGADIQRIALWTTSGERITATALQMDGNRVRLEFSPPFLLERRQTRLLELRADVRASRRRTLQLLIEEPSDLESIPTRGGR